MGKLDKITAEMLRDALDYEPETGRLIWKRRNARYFTGPSVRSPDRRANGWNAKWSGKTAFTTINPNGYLCGAVFGIPIVAHRVAWTIIHGEWPLGEIDHINGDKLDNRIANLRDVTREENLHNQPRRVTNTSGVTGVFWNARSKNWRAYICINSRLTHIGYFKNFDDAVAARKEAERRHDYHPNHGREACSSAA
jgi:hypothetical protein